MHEMIDFKAPTRVIIHFKQDQLIAEKHGTRIVRYQVILGDNLLSPSGDFVRFNNSAECEVHGWVPVDDIVVDEVLEQLSEVAVAA